MPKPPYTPLRRDGDRLFLDTAAGVVEIVASGRDRKAARWWQAVDATGLALSPMVATPRIAVAFVQALRNKTAP